MNIAINMFTLRNTLLQDADKAIQQIAEIGYNYIEICPAWHENCFKPLNNGLHNPDRFPKDEKKWLDSYGIKVFGTHITDYELYDPYVLNAMLRWNAELGTESIGHCGGYFANLEHIKRSCDAYNAAAKIAHDMGMKFHYHNHFADFLMVEGKYALDWVMEYTNPELIDFELDTYWAMRGGADYIAMIDRYPGRLCMIHQKDFPKNMSIPTNLFDGIYEPSQNFIAPGMTVPTTECCLTANCYLNYKTFTEIGTGIMNIQGIIDEGNRVGCPTIMVEQDRSQLTELDSARISYDNLRKYKGIVA